MERVPTPEQREAIHDRHPDILVEAGAGSGKTATTVDRYMQLLDEGVETSEILVFTFTEKAANELRERVRKRLGPQSTSIGKAWIGTFHAICGAILRSHPIQADVDPAFSVIDDVQAAELKDAAYMQALSDFMSDARREDVIARFTPSELQKGVGNAYEQLRSRGNIRPTLPKPRTVDVSSALVELTKEAIKAGDATEIGANGKTRTVSNGSLGKLSDLLGVLELKGESEVTYEDLKPDWIDSTALGLRDVVKPLRTARAAVAARDFGDAVSEDLAVLFETYSDRYAEMKAERGLLDYEDLQLKALELLTSESAPHVGNGYRNRFTEIMVDEFQDTNRLQLELIKSLRGEQTRLFTVGDEMQAIYGFRHADVRLFRQRRESPAVKRLTLSANFRSQAPVLGAVNLIGRMLDQQAVGIREEDGEGQRHEFAPLKVGLEEDPDVQGEVELFFTRPDGWLEAELGPLAPATDPETFTGSALPSTCQAEALLVAQDISAQVREGKVTPGEVAILFRTKANMWMYAEALKQVGLVPYVVGGSGFWSSREGVEVRSLLATVANPLDDDALIGALAGPACGLTPDALLILRESDRRSPLWPALQRAAAGDERIVLTDSDRDRGRRFVEAVSRVRTRMQTRSLTDLFDSVIDGTGYDLANLVRDPSGAGLANIRRIASIAADFEAEGDRDLRGFLRWIDASAELDAEAAVATEDEGGDVVRLMTVHKAKGLQFDSVYVADLGKQRNSSTETVFWIGADPADPDGDLRFGLRLPMPGGENVDLYDWTDLAAAAKLEKSDEELRLFHVALTRAERRLVVSGIVDLEELPVITESTPTGPRVASALGIDGKEPETVLAPAPGSRPDLESIPAPTNLVITRSCPDEDSAMALSRSVEGSGSGDNSPTGRPPLGRPSTPSYPDVPLSFTALSEFTECPTRFYAGRILKLKEPDEQTISLDPDDLSPNLRREGTKFGSAIHELFETCAGNRWTPPTSRQVSKALESWGLDPTEGTHVQRAESMIAGFLDSELGVRVSRTRCDIEVPVLVRLGDVTVRGFADLLDRNSSPPLILDYKTNRLDSKSPAEKMDDYGLQRDLYGLAVAHAEGAESVETAFVFLEKPAEPVVKLLAYDDLDEARTRIRNLLGEIAGQEFFGGPGAGHQPCGQCWACEMLKVQRERALAG